MLSRYFSLLLLTSFIVICDIKIAYGFDFFSKDTTSDRITRSTLILDISPMIKDPSDDEFFIKHAEELYLSEWLPYRDVYIPILDRNTVPLTLDKWIVEKSGVTHLTVNLSNWSLLTKKLQQYVIHGFYLKKFGFTAYNVEPIEWVNIESSASGTVRTPFGQDNARNNWFETWNNENGRVVDANCFSLALSGSGFDSGYPSHFKAKDFDRVLKSNYQEVTEPKTGDIMVLENSYGYNAHAALFIGFSNTSDRHRIFLTKNGTGIGTPLFVDEYTLINRNYPDTQKATFWRLKGNLPW